MNRRALLKALAAVAFLPSMAWAGVKRPAVISAFDGSGPRYDTIHSFAPTDVPFLDCIDRSRTPTVHHEWQVADEAR